jgi:putative (di)nucleoside polyphosphate hydrolase
MTRRPRGPAPDPDTLVPHEDRPYRAGVGIVLFNARGMAFVGERIDQPGAWQMPQGGIDDGEAPEIAVFRELEEEIGTRNARILGMMEQWLFYDIPAHTANKLWSGKYRGQKQKWVALEFLGTDADIRLDASDHPEFGRWQWLPIHELLDHIVSFKRDMYRQVIDEFSHHADALADNASGE